MSDFNLLNNLPLEALPIEKNFKLKIYAIVSTHKDIPDEAIRDKMILTLVLTYDLPAALVAVEEGIKEAGRAISDYNLTRMLIERNADNLIDFRSVQAFASPLPETKEIKIQKGKQEMIAYVRYIFDKAGTPEEKVVCENVVAKYEKIKNA